MLSTQRSGSVLYMVTFAASLWTVASSTMPTSLSTWTGIKHLNFITPSYDDEDGNAQHRLNAPNAAAVLRFFNDLVQLLDSRCQVVNLSFDGPTFGLLEDQVATLMYKTTLNRIGGLQLRGDTPTISTLINVLQGVPDEQESNEPHHPTSLVFDLLREKPSLWSTCRKQLQS